MLRVMAANIATLKALSQGLLTLLFPSLQNLREFFKRADTRDFWANLLKDPRRELERLAKAVKPLVSPLSEASDAESLKHSVAEQLPAYLGWKGELFALLLEALERTDLAQFLDAYADASQQIQQFFEEKAKVYLDEEDTERLLLAVSGVCFYSENLMRTVLEGGPEALDPDAVKATIEDFVKADLLLMTAALIMIGEIKPWRWIVVPSERHSQPAKILSLIAQQAEAHVDAIEDELLIRNPEFRCRMDELPGPSITLEEYSRRRGL